MYSRIKMPCMSQAFLWLGILRSEIEGKTGLPWLPQWMRIHLATQGTWVRFLVREDPTSQGAGKPKCHDFWACALDLRWWFSCLVVSDSCDLVDCSLPGSSVHGMLQARTLEWVAMSFSRGSSPPRDWSRVSYIAGRFFTIWTARETSLKIGGY